MSLAGISARMQNCLNLTPGRTWPRRASPLPRAGSAGGEETKERVLAAKQERAHPIETSHFTLILLMMLPRLREGQRLLKVTRQDSLPPATGLFLSVHLVRTNSPSTHPPWICSLSCLLCTDIQRGSLFLVESTHMPAGSLVYLVIHSNCWQPPLPPATNSLGAKSSYQP